MEHWWWVVAGRFRELAAEKRMGIESGILNSITEEFIAAVEDGEGEILAAVGEKEELAMRIEKTIAELKGE
jgi:hypothetical protein